MKYDVSIDQSDFTKNVYDFEDIKQCWENIVFTIPGTIPLMPDFGCNIFQYLDRPTSDSFGKARNVIIAALEKWEKRAKITKVTRTIEGSIVLINIFGVATSTGAPIQAQINITPEPVPATAVVSIMYIGYVTDNYPTENAVKAMQVRGVSIADQSFTYTIDFKRPCFFFPTSLGSLVSIRDSESYEIISGFTKTMVNFTINGLSVSYMGYTLTHPATLTGSTITFKFI